MLHTDDLLGAHVIGNEKWELAQGKQRWKWQMIWHCNIITFQSPLCPDLGKADPTLLHCMSTCVWKLTVPVPLLAGKFDYQIITNN